MGSAGSEYWLPENDQAKINSLRRVYHKYICENILCLDADGTPNLADKSSEVSSEISRRLIAKLLWSGNWCTPISGQTAGSRFEDANRRFLGEAFRLIHHLRPGNWRFDITGDISQFQQYKHLAELRVLLRTSPHLKAFLGSDYLITPDVIVARYPLEDNEINLHEHVVDEDRQVAAHTPLRSRNHVTPSLLLHASISVKWTLRSDRAQNIRTESLNLLRNRKGHTPRIAAITAEPLPSRIASIALGSSDIDCVYHFALPELRSAVLETGSGDSIEIIETLIAGERLRDISDLPFDLAI